MWIAQVVNVPDMPVDVVAKAIEEIKQYECDVFYSEGTFPKNEEGHSIIVLNKELEAPIFWHEFFS